MTTKEMYNILAYIIEVNTETIDCMIAINGNNETTYKDILFWKTGYRTFEQYEESEGWV